MLGSFGDAEDAVQDTLLSAWQRLSGFEERASLRTWLYRIATNRCLNALRSASRRPAEAWDIPEVEPPGPTRPRRCRRTGIINQIRAFLLERGVAVRQGLRFLRAELPRILATSPATLSARMLRVIEDLAGDWRRLDERIEGLSNEIEVLARHDPGCERLMSVPGIGPIISSAMVAAIGAGDGFSKGRDFAAWLGLVPKQISTGDRTISSARYRSAAVATCGFCSFRPHGLY
jgi:RNA polymerase sigma factor (sigma-70 family)